jgi:hypothetical protein
MSPRRGTEKGKIKLRDSVSQWLVQLVGRLTAKLVARQAEYSRASLGKIEVVA